MEPSAQAALHSKTPSPGQSVLAGLSLPILSEVRVIQLQERTCKASFPSSPASF